MRTHRELRGRAGAQQIDGGGRGDERLVDVCRSSDVGEAEAVVRSQSLIVGFRVLERPIPPELRGYATCGILEDGTIVRLAPHAPAASRDRPCEVPVPQKK